MFRAIAATLTVTILSLSVWNLVAQTRYDARRAMWSQFKHELQGPNGNEYFATEMKGLGCPRLKGTLISAEDNQLVLGLTDSVHPEVKLVLKDKNGKDVKLSGKPKLGKELEFEGIFAAFTKDPFMLTVDTQIAQVRGLELEP